ncbi:MAG: DNA (cytosine-5-)-methyltransferase [Candidatus Thermoplasmatota archaeon]
MPVPASSTEAVVQQSFPTEHGSVEGLRCESRCKTHKHDPWGKWPSTTKIVIPILAEHPCYDRTWGLEPRDGRWKTRLADSIERRRRRIPSGTRDRQEILDAIDRVTLRTYHAARVLQTHFNNPSHENYRDPFLETMYIMLTWRTRIPDARARLRDIMDSFKGPRALLSEDGLLLLRNIIKRSGFSGKRPEMITELTRRFIEEFPDGDTQVMRAWKDDEIIRFLTSMPGIGLKSALCVMMYSLDRDRFPIDTHVGRVLKRTQMLRELVTVGQDTDHKTVQATAEFAAPPSARMAIHAGLVSLGQTICRVGTPSCGKCPIRHVCEYYRMMTIENTEGALYSHVDLFCGAGGFSEGFSKERFRTVLAVDFDQDACETFRMNHPGIPEENVVCEDLARRQVKTFIKNHIRGREQLRPGAVDVLTAGIPCQGFSKAGYRSRPGLRYEPLKDPRNLLYRRVLLWIRDLKPRYIVLENVPEIRSAGGKEASILDTICRSLGKLGYRVDSGVVNARDHRVPQTRYRMIVIASHQSVPEVKIEDLGGHGKKGSTLGRAIGDLPPLTDSGNPYYLNWSGSVLTGHVSRSNNDDDLEIFEALEPGEKYQDFAKRRKDILQARRRRGKHAVYGTRSFEDKYYKLDPDSPSRTIVAHLHKDGNGYIHPFQTRSISIREAMRLQGFPDDYIFCGSATRQYIQIGNAVPPPLARDIARLLAQNLNSAWRV